MTQDQLERIKERQLEIMDEIHRLCETNKISYYIIGGTLLGAVRHKGFIPWDVDIDIAMTREEYIRFKEICARELGRDYFYTDYHDEKNYIAPHARVCDRNSRLEIKFDRLNSFNMVSGIYIDVFPLDNAPDDVSLREWQAQKLKAVRILKERRIPYSYSAKRWKRIAHHIRSFLLSWISVPKLNAYQQNLMMKFSSEDTQCVCSMASQYAYSKQCMPREIYGTPVLLEFEGRKYYAPEKYTDYLTRIYGDYMQLPPEEKRRANMEIYRTVEFF